MITSKEGHYLGIISNSTVIEPSYEIDNAGLKRKKNHSKVQSIHMN